MNEREQLAKDNGMTIEFVNWFFDKKKDGCGNAWFIMMAAMWEGWKVQESRCSWLAAERDALREGEMGDARHSNTRAAADIYFQLVEECEITAGGSLVEYVDNMRDELKAANKTSEARKQGLIRAHKMFQREKARAEAVEKRLEEVRGYNVDLAEESRQYQQRVAELEEREVKMPELKMLRDYLAEVTHREREDILLGVKLEFHRALQAAGIKGD